MDLLQTVRKEGSRGGRADFKWEDVKNDQHRENYLGHSLMAPVGRWQINKDLSWYAKGDEDGAPSAEDIRKEEIRRIKEAEADAINIALGLPVASKNPNLAPLGEKASESDVKKALAQGTGDDTRVPIPPEMFWKAKMTKDHHRVTSLLKAKLESEGGVVAENGTEGADIMIATGTREGDHDQVIGNDIAEHGQVRERRDVGGTDRGQESV
ncbi:MAG: hypothetical protein M1821_002626 [Bathelium mastoideum]|nr:MAG: hypothetical protein M1821_002626 [Bathelium mastoideum]